MIGIIDYGLGNLASIRNMLSRLEIESTISGDPRVLAESTHLVLPGVGAFDQGIANLHRLGLWDPLNEFVLHHGKPILGICLGAQLLTESSDEGEANGLGWIKGHTVAFDRAHLTSKQRIPNMGWRYVDVPCRHPLTSNFPDDARFYFVHSYHLSCDDAADVILNSRHGYSFACGVAHGNVMGVQFHPEKSHRFGMRLLQNFAALATADTSMAER